MCKSVSDLVICLMLAIRESKKNVINCVAMFTKWGLQHFRFLIYLRYLDMLAQFIFKAGLNRGGGRGVLYKQWQGKTTTSGATFPTLCERCVGSFMSPCSYNQYRENAGDVPILDWNVKHHLKVTFTVAVVLKSPYVRNLNCCWRG